MQEETSGGYAPYRPVGRVGPVTDYSASTTALLNELAPTAEALYERHVSTCKPWYPHEIVPWSLGRDFTEGEAWDPQDFPLPDAIRSALYVNLLTEDNLPYYFQTVDRMFSRDSIWKVWSHRWTAEEARHSIAIRDYLTITRAIDPRALEDGRMVQMSGGEVPQPETPLDGVVYVALQELATRIAHRNTGRLLQESAADHPAIKAGYDVMARVATDENFHYLFYRDLASAAFKVDPSGTVIALERQVREFEMPGTGIIGFAAHAKAIADANIYNLIQHHEQILVPVVLRHWAVDKLEGLTAEAEQARQKLITQIDRIGRLAQKMAERTARRAETQPAFA
jgi:acyl-[acyl-carrier-protein] desaturase